MSSPAAESPAPETHVLIAQRMAKRDELAARGVLPYGARFPDTQLSSELLANFEEGRAVRYAGRLMTRRDMGKTHFAHVQDSAGKLQLFVNKDAVGEENFANFKLLDLGDILGVEGTLFTTKTGEKSIKVSSLTVLSKALRPLPDKWHGLADVEQRYRQRYLDLITNDDVRRLFAMRSKLVAETRRFLEARGYMEVETPMMQPVAGGAAATPFKTHHNALDMPLFLRIAPELYLKRVLVGGFERIFEINRNFRNEGISRKHNPEFTMLEAYCAYGDYELMADLVEELICHLATFVPADLRPETAPQIDWTRPWKRVRYHEAIRTAAGADWFDISPEARVARAGELGVEIIPGLTDIEVSNQIFEKLVEARTINPVFYTHLPTELVPLAKQNAQDPSVVDVYELIINGQEISPGYSELNDPAVQRQRLIEQAEGEKHALDEDFLCALEHGMPPAGGIGVGIDRLVATLCGADSLRDIILFPLQRHK